ncbi:phage protein NinX family protein [Pseudomonas oryzihabitans]|uniref:phage protein NinX family protein n=1 Tax=Pseudomonas oryzihabitans TaxID=47885 RepID=UPI0028AEFC04|nr:phage protein NinX family protein [Pseudomonas oryzihabitans]
MAESTMKAVLTIELEAEALDWAVADALGLECPHECDADGVWRRWYQPLLSDGEPTGDMEPFHPSIDWAQCGALIHAHLVSVRAPDSAGGCWTAWLPKFGRAFKQGGPTAQIAVCRAIVLSKQGPAVAIPSELLESLA